jgi:hypothetical protein
MQIKNLKNEAFLKHMHTYKFTKEARLISGHHQWHS